MTWGDKAGGGLATEQIVNHDPAQGLTWDNLEQKLTALYSLKHNALLLADRGMTPQMKAHRLRQEVAIGFAGRPRERQFAGPLRFFRAVGAKDPLKPLANNSYGDWWFEEDLVRRLECQVGRVFFTDEERRRSFSDTIRAGLAIAYEWDNPMSEYWILELPAGARLTGLTGTAAPQPHAAKPHPKYDWTRTLPGGLPQVYFPVKNPLWVKRYW